MNVLLVVEVVATDVEVFVIQIVGDNDGDAVVMDNVTNEVKSLTL